MKTNITFHINLVLLCESPEHYSYYGHATCSSLNVKQKIAVFNFHKANLVNSVTNMRMLQYTAGVQMFLLDLTLCLLITTRIFLNPFY